MALKFNTICLPGWIPQRGLDQPNMTTFAMTGSYQVTNNINEMAIRDCRVAKIRNNTIVMS